MILALLILIYSIFFIYCIFLEIRYRDEIEKRTHRIKHCKIHWEGVPGNLSSIIITHDDFGILGSIPSLMHSNISIMNRQQLVKIYTNAYYKVK